MADLKVGDVVRVVLPRGFNKRGVLGVNVMYQTWIEARFDGAIGTVVDIDPRGVNGIPMYHVDFHTHDNSRLGLPKQGEKFRAEWLQPVEAKAAR